MTASATDRLMSLRDELLELQQHALTVEGIAEDEIALVSPARHSARHTSSYSRRQRELADLARLAARRLQLLGGAGHVMSTIEAVLGVLDALCDQAHPPLDQSLYPSVGDARSRLRDLPMRRSAPVTPKTRSDHGDDAVGSRYRPCDRDGCSGRGWRDARTARDGPPSGQR